MESSSTPLHHTPPGGVSEDLLQELHAATTRLHEGRKEMEDVASDFDFGHEQKVAASGDRIREAERSLEEVSEKIKKSLAEKSV